MIIIIIIIISPMVTIPICSNPKPTILIKREIVLCVANLTTMHLNAEIERETIILLKLRSSWLKEKTSLLRLFLKSIWLPMRNIRW
jgi:hypothetical protein